MGGTGRMSRMVIMDSSTRSRIACDAHIVLVADDRVLLARRAVGRGFGAGRLNLPAGHHEPGESIDATARREAWEELGIVVPPGGTELVHVMHHHEREERMSFFFRLLEWEGKVQNRELHTCSGLEWHDLERLPDDLMEYARQAIESMQEGSAFSSLRHRSRHGEKEGAPRT